MTTEPRILVVDDDPAIRFFLQETLERDGYTVVNAESGEEALNYISAWEFDLALVDLRMTGIGGIEVMAELRQQSPDTPVIILTGHASLETAVETLRQGAHDYLFKPCKTVELRESVRRGLVKRQEALYQRELLADRAHPPDATSLGINGRDDSRIGGARFIKHGGLMVDLLRHIITLDGVLLELSPTEFDLLAYMVSEAPRVIPPKELVREVQGYEAQHLEASDLVRYHIYRIRRKISVVAGRSGVIRTVRGVGYTVEG